MGVISHGAARVTARRVPNDPGRRERIVRAALELMGRDGLHTLTHRMPGCAGGRTLAAMTVGYVTAHRARTVLDYELYVAGLLRGGALSEEWIGLLRTALRARFDPHTADALTAATDGGWCSGPESQQGGFAPVPPQ